MLIRGGVKLTAAAALCGPSAAALNTQRVTGATALSYRTSHLFAAGLLFLRVFVSSEARELLNINSRLSYDLLLTRTFCLRP